MTTREACYLMGVHRTTIWRWIESGLHYERESEHPYRYFYKLGELQRMKRARAAARIAVPQRNETEYDYS